MFDKTELFEKYVILKALEKNSWRKSATAKELGVSRQTLDLKIKKHNIDKNSIPPDPRDFLIDLSPPEKKRIVSHSFSMPEDELETLRRFTKEINRKANRKVSASELVRLAIKLLREQDPSDIFDKLP
ncbi:MAG: helix-turn-helix domain-containing protein [Deltaproteobacteria bacterium]|nr:helix-turn-helix domain-containing protein [Deltaproteobacteria bacterium]